MVSLRGGTERERLPLFQASQGAANKTTALVAAVRNGSLFEAGVPDSNCFKRSTFEGIRWPQTQLRASKRVETRGKCIRLRYMKGEAEVILRGGGVGQ